MMTEDELIESLKERQNNGRIAYLTFGELVAMVPATRWMSGERCSRRSGSAGRCLGPGEDRD
jgi:hypothetical protein